MAKVVFLVLSGILAYASAEHPLPHSFYPPPPPKPHLVYGVPDIHSSIFVKPEPIVFGPPHKPAIVHGIPEFDKIPDLSYIAPEIKHHAVIPHHFKPRPIASYHKYKLPQHISHPESKYEIPHNHPQPAPVYGLPKIF